MEGCRHCSGQTGTRHPLGRFLRLCTRKRPTPTHGLAAAGSRLVQLGHQCTGSCAGSPVCPSPLCTGQLFAGSPVCLASCPCPCTVLAPAHLPSSLCCQALNRPILQLGEQIPESQGVFSRGHQMFEVCLLLLLEEGACFIRDWSMLSLLHMSFCSH